MQMMKLTKNTPKKEASFKWNYTPPKINGGKQTIDEMSMIQGLYQNYEVTKTGNLIAILEISGINLDLLNDNEQEDVFEEYSAFLMSTVGEGINDSIQFIEPTIPVDMNNYLNGLKKNYLKLKKENPEQTFKIQLLASYIDHYTEIQNDKSMTTKQHLIVTKVPIKDKTFESLELATNLLDEKTEQLKRDLQNSMTDYDLSVKILNAREISSILQNLINFKS
ncbi:MAG: conjugal transfer protein [Tetragenococcus koreensis]|nr:conjugal transfer protein [Tetragenococcus koreensis]MDN6269854.1 conjugal transfer protein [Tetragenococcus koreensis]MDN6496712.1 conjugal transfer protein [Tetragenococcus koreensis]